MSSDDPFDADTTNQMLRQVLDVLAATRQTDPRPTRQRNH